MYAFTTVASDTITYMGVETLQYVCAFFKRGIVCVHICGVSPRLQTTAGDIDPVCARLNNLSLKTGRQLCMSVV